MWSFSILGEPETFELAARSAADAHLLILSFAGTTHLPRTVKDWVERWVRIARHKPALVTLTDQKATGRRWHGYAFLLAEDDGISRD